VKSLAFLVYVTFAAALSVICFLRPIADNFDRYMYEAVTRSLNQNWNEFYPIVKHEYWRVEQSSVMDSAEHMAQLEPLYAIRPLYIEAIAVLNRCGFGYQQAITVVQVVSFFAIALLVGIWTKELLYSALLLLVPQILDLGRGGSPEPLNALAILAGLYLILHRNRTVTGLGLLSIAVWIRTDSVLVLLVVLGWLAVKGRLRLWIAGVFAAIGITSVQVINHFSGNYGYLVLFRYSFLGGRAPALIHAHLSAREYATVFLHGVVPIAPQISLWIILAIAGCQLRSRFREWIPVLGLAAVLHFILFPSGEGRYLAWFYVFVGVVFIQALQLPRRLGPPNSLNRARI
jgi:hypothetical protein